MNTNMSISNSNMNFKAHLSDKFLDAADGYYRHSKQAGEYKQFCSAIRRFGEIPNTDNITLLYKKIRDSKQNVFHMLIAQDKETGTETLLITKDLFRKLLKKFSYMNEYEFKTKMGLIKKH